MVTTDKLASAYHFSPSGYASQILPTLQLSLPIPIMEKVSHCHGSKLEFFCGIQYNASYLFF
jgi:hypothetical protein